MWTRTRIQIVESYAENQNAGIGRKSRGTESSSTDTPHCCWGFFFRWSWTHAGKTQLSEVGQPVSPNSLFNLRLIAVEQLQQETPPWDPSGQASCHACSTSWPGVLTKHPGIACLFHLLVSFSTFSLFPCRSGLTGRAYYELSVGVKVSECVRLSRLSSSDAVEESRVSVTCVHTNLTLSSGS